MKPETLQFILCSDPLLSSFISLDQRVKQLPTVKIT